MLFFGSSLKPSIFDFNSKISGACSASSASSISHSDLSVLLKINGEQKTQVYLNHNLTNLFSKNLFTQQSLFGVDFAVGFLETW